MKNIINRLDEIEHTVMDELKDFQKATVNRIDYLYRKGQNRILVSDEVGLGKTLVARGTIAKFAQLRKQEGDDLVKVVYICSNASIAEQNLDKLRIVNEIKAESSNTSRLSMQHLNIFNQENDESVLNRYVQLIPLTPQTSFKVSNSQGTVDERALMYAILKRIPEFSRYKRMLEKILRFGVRYWIDVRDYFESEVVKCDKKSGGKYIKYMVSEVQEKLKTTYYEDEPLWDSFGSLIRKRTFDKAYSKKFIVQLRSLFADISLNKLNPDLIIMDEFQRFKYLLDSEKNSEMDRLTSKFFNSDDVRILMLSATPYKMYSTLDEIDEEQIDAHYKEFFDVINFLNHSEAEKDKFRQVWNNYSIKLKEFSQDKTSFLVAKRDAEDAMFKNICRTERITEGEIGDLIDSTDSKYPLEVLTQDITSYIEAQELLDSTTLNINVPMDYIKSTPYIMSFMKNYQLKRKIERYFHKNPREIHKMKRDTFWLNEAEINNYQKIPPNNARLKNLMEHVLKDNASNLLWVPPSRPYYELGGAFRGCEGFSKTLIFSSWEMVPRMISSLVSYEVDRKTIGRLNRGIKYFSEGRFPSPRMRFSLKNDVPMEMSLFCLIYPSSFLIDIYNPIDCLNRGLTLSEIEAEIKSKISCEVDKLECNENSREDLRWYHLAPMLLDSQSHVESWFRQSDELVKSGYYFRKGFLTHYRELKSQYKKFKTAKLGKKPDDLVDVLCDIAIASPAICTYRAYENELPEFSSMDRYVYAPTQIARRFIDKLNLPQSIAVIDLNSTKNSEDTYWKNVLKYSKDGNLQSVFDEYIHLLSNGLDRNNDDRIEIIHNKFLTSFEFKTTSYDIDTFNTFKSRINDVEYDNLSLRTHFAVSFTKGNSDESDSNRKNSVRDAFNSPFRPFVLASTSIGQEGLDFHNYCRRVVHWNLPSNPIDLEQREGRINRFECLAIRQNIAKRYGDGKFRENIWEELFEKAALFEKNDDCSDLIPYWGLREEDDMVKIERIVPIYPFSRDEIKYDRLIKILSLYRLTLGQARQEELLEAISDKIDFKDDNLKEMFINLSPYYKDFEFESENDFKVDLPFNYKLYDLTSNDRQKVEEYHNIRYDDADLTNYALKLKEKFNLEKSFDGKLFDFTKNIFWISFPDVVLGLARLEMLVHGGYLEVKLRHDNISNGKSLYEYLFELKDEIESKLGFELLWNKHKSAIWEISIFVPIDIKKYENDALNWHIFMLNRFYEVFSDKISEYFKDNPLKLDNIKLTQYWFGLSEKLSDFNLETNIIPHYFTWFTVFLDDVPFSECRIEMHAYTSNRPIKTSIVIERSRKDLYKYLLDNKSDIESEIGFELEWEKNRGRRYIRITNKIDIRDRNNWQEAIDWHLNTALKFKQVFNNKIKEFYKNVY